jgi:signal transduction histidine kinase
MVAGQDTEAILKRIVEGCATNVAAFDEAGAFLCASGSWRMFAEKNGFSSVRDAYGLYDLQTCRNQSEGLAVKQVRFRESIQRIIGGLQRGFQEEYTFKSLTEPHWFMTKATRLEMPNGFRVLVTLEDVTSRRLAEEELRNIGGRLINAQEDERKRIARELHDDVSQRLALLSLEIDRIRPDLLTSHDCVKNGIERLATMTRELGSEIHRLSYQLHPFKLDHVGLNLSIQSLCAELSLNRDLEIKFRQKGFPAVLTNDVTLCVFRIAQELLHNVIKHSGASNADVALTKTASGLRLSVSDNGNGFDVDEAKKKKRLGLISIGERLRLVNGKLSIRSRPRQGTQIDILVPLA